MVFSAEYTLLLYFYSKSNVAPLDYNYTYVYLEAQIIFTCHDMFYFTVDVDWKKGACSGTVYSGEDDLSDLMAKVCNLSNTLSVL